MNQQEFVEHTKKIFEDCHELLKKKNADYGGGHANPFKNFNASKSFGIEPEDALVVRITDKIARISNLLHREAKIKDEKIDDTIMDAINYLVILHAYISQDIKKQKFEPTDVTKNSHTIDMKGVERNYE